MDKKEIKVHVLCAFELLLLSWRTHADAFAPLSLLLLRLLRVEDESHELEVCSLITSVLAFSLHTATLASCSLSDAPSRVIQPLAKLQEVDYTLLVSSVSRQKGDVKMSFSFPFLLIKALH